MASQFDACARYGCPCLQIRDAATDMVRLLWRPQAEPEPLDPLAPALLAEEALHTLFKQLFLRSGEQRLAYPALARRRR